MIRYALALSALSLTTLPADAETSARCAAFWGAWVEVAAEIPALPQDPADAALAQAFRAAAVADGSGSGLQRDTRTMARMIRAAILGDATSQALMQRTALACEEAARARGLL